jgi:hydroxymethylglutaryl-CoA reductase (NADPH)
MDTFVQVVKNAKDDNWARNMTAKKAPSQKVDIPRGYGKQIVEDRWKLLANNEQYRNYMNERTNAHSTMGADISLADAQPDPRTILLDEETLNRNDIFKDNIENFVGTVKVPLGIAGPLRVNGLHANGDYYIPLATTEAALVASISRGIDCINQSGGCTAAVILEGVNRDPCFQFNNLMEAGQFVAWSATQFENYKLAAEKTTRHGKLADIKYVMEGRDVHMKCVYTTGDASGQNIVTIATENIVDYILENSPVKPIAHYLEGGMSGDKKGNHSVMTYVRGKRVIAEVVLPAHVVQTTLHVTPEKLIEATGSAQRGLIMAGTLGLNCHFSNGLTAMAIALGQDPACAAECHVGLARCELTKEGNVYISVTLPNILVGTVGGGTKLPSQRACLELMGLYGSGKANALAEVMAAVLLAGDISLGSAVVSGDFAKAHKILARDSSDPINLEVDSLGEAFQKAQAMLVKMSNIPSRDDIMKIYGLYKQATVGDINIERPGLFSFDLKAKAKYDAWAQMKGKSKEKATREYIDLVLKLVESSKE